MAIDSYAVVLAADPRAAQRKGAFIPCFHRDPISLGTGDGTALHRQRALQPKQDAVCACEGAVLQRHIALQHHKRRAGGHGEGDAGGHTKCGRNVVFTIQPAIPRDALQQRNRRIVPIHRVLPRVVQLGVTFWEPSANSTRATMAL